MDNRYNVIKDLVIQACKRLQKDGIPVDAIVVDKLVANLSGSKNLERDILRREKNIRTKHEINEVLNSELTEAKNLQNLSVEYNGITLNSQDIDLMMISCSNNFEELADALDNIININVFGTNENETSEELDDTLKKVEKISGFSLKQNETFEELDDTLKKIEKISGFSLKQNETFEEYRQRVFGGYLDGLVTRNECIRNINLHTVKKIEKLKQSGILTSNEIGKLDKIFLENTGKETYELYKIIESEFGKDKSHEMLIVMRDYEPEEKDGIKNSTISSFRKLDSVIDKRYDSITIDEEAKYGNVMLGDGTFYDKHLRKALDYAKSKGKQVRINTLMFYMDCPEEIYNLEEGPEASNIARKKLESYVDNVTKVLADYPDVVRSVDVFNELLNRFAINGDVSYMLRNEIPQDKDSFGEVDDNVKSGWLKHLTVEDICEVLAIARENLPKVDFMYNDDNLVDKDKIGATKELIQRIQDYSKGLGVQLIDSIGTQMHIDNDVSKEDIRQMFLSLAELGLPIEITEFDLAMTNGMEGLSSSEIEKIRQHKINEIYEVIEELKEECNIRGVTIWSKTDSKNFRVTLKNKELIKQEKEPITTLHGGMFTEDMRDKSYLFKKECRKQNFNYHGHTKRCGHASDVLDSEYVDAARKANVMHIGFSDHVALSGLEDWQVGQKMHISEVDEYIASINKLQEDNPDMVIRCGFEAEFSPLRTGHLSELRDKCDYMILGQHYVEGFSDEKDISEYPLVYAESVCQAMKTGIFDIVAHPDIFLKKKNDCISEEANLLFMENAKKASYMICETAKEMGIPLELNVGCVQDAIDTDFLSVASVFWDAVREVGNDVLYANDAHDPIHYLEIDEDRDCLESNLNIDDLNFVDDDYDPVLARENNETLQEAYSETQENAVTYETALIQNIISNVNVEEGQEINDAFNEKISCFRDSLRKRTSNQFEKEEEEFISKIIELELSSEQKEKLNKDYELKQKRMIETMQLREEAFLRAHDSVAEAHSIGCETKDEYVNVIVLLTESKTTENPNKIDVVSQKLDSFKESKNVEKSFDNGDSPKVYVYSNNNTNNSSSNNADSGDGGFTNSLELLLVVGIVILLSVILVIVLR